MNIDIDSKAGGMLVYNEGNHADQGNPHGQYINKRMLYTIPYITDFTKVYNNFCNIKLLTNDRSVMLNFIIYNANNSAKEDIEYANIVVRVNCSGSLASGNKNTSVKCMSSSNFDINNLKVIVTQNDSNGYEVKLFLKQWDTWRGYKVQPLTEYTSKYYIDTRVDFIDNSQATNTLPSGEEIEISNINEDLRKFNYYIKPNTSSINKCVKLFDIELNGTNISKVVNVSLYGTNGGDTLSFVNFVVRAYVNSNANLLAEVVLLNNSETLGRSSIVGTIIKSDSTSTILSVYMQSSRLNEEYYFSINNETNIAYNPKIVVPKTFIWEDNLPTGKTVVNAIGRKVLYLGSDVTLTRSEPYTLSTTATFKHGTTGRFGASYFVLGTFYLWVDSSDRLRMKNGVPFSDTDGTIVGTQS